MKNSFLKANPVHEKNLKKVLGDVDDRRKILDRAFGIIKHKKGEKFSAVAYQRKVRQGWAKRLKH